MGRFSFIWICLPCFCFDERCFFFWLVSPTSFLWKITSQMWLQWTNNVSFVTDDGDVSEISVKIMGKTPWGKGEGGFFIPIIVLPPLTKLPEELYFRVVHRSLQPSMLISSATEGEEGYVLTPLCLFFCLSVCRISQKFVDGSRWNLEGRLGVTRTKWLDFDEDPDLDPTTRIFKVILHQWEIRPKMICSMISQKAVDRFGWNFVDTLGVWQGRIDSILVKIWIRIWIRELLNYLKWFFTVKRSGQKQ